MRQPAESDAIDDPPDLSFEVTAAPGEADGLSLDHRRFPFAGKFGRRNTGTAVARADDAVIAAIAFSSDATDETCCRIRYVAVRREVQGRGIGPRFVADFVEYALASGYRSVKMAADTPHAVTALERADFGYIGETAPRGEVVLAYPDPGTHSMEEAYRQLLARDDLPDRFRRYCRSRLSSRLSTPDDSD